MDEISLARFWSKVEKSDGCWRWLGAVNNKGYGVLRRSQKNYLAHRFAWFVEHGAWPSGLLMHACDNPRCVNPRHLSIGTQRENCRDMARRGRAGSQVMTEPMAREALRRVAEGETHKSVATSMGVSKSAIHELVRGRNWRWLHG